MIDNRTLAVAGIRKAFDECEHDEETGMACDECLVDATVKALEYADRERAQDLAAMTAERDAIEYARIDACDTAVLMGAERDAARTERDAANAARESQWKELQAARADAEAASKRATNAEAWTGRDTGHAVLVRLAALEAEHEAWARFSGDDLQSLRNMKAAHAAVEALRTVKP